MYTIPIAYFITFRCYGTWLHGDARGSVDKQHNVFDTLFLPPDARLEERRRAETKYPPVHLDAQRRVAVEEAVRDTCCNRSWELHSLSVRGNHVHVVVGAGDAIAEMVLNAFKANATRVMRLHGCWLPAHTPWSTGGSTCYLWNNNELARAIHYVLECQD